MLWMLSSALSFSLMVVCVRAVGTRIPLAEVVLVRAVVSVALSAALLWRARVPPLGNRRGLLMLTSVILLRGQTVRRGQLASPAVPVSASPS